MFIPADVTVADFKAQFPTGFNYLPVWSEDTTYYIGQIVYYPVSQSFYTCKNNGVTSVPTTTSDWTLNTAVNITDYVSNEAINAAFAEAITVFNTRFNGTDASLKLMYLYLTAHYVVMDARGGGTQSGASGLVSSRSVGNVSESYVIPKWMQKEGLSFYTTTYYGYKYLNLTYPYRVGNIAAIRGNGPYTVPIAGASYYQY